MGIDARSESGIEFRGHRVPGTQYLIALRIALGCAATATRCLAWCLMDNHVHLILVPDTADGLRAALGEAHRRYTRRINFREGWRGFLFQGRFASYPMGDAAQCRWLAKRKPGPTARARS